MVLWHEVLKSLGEAVHNKLFLQMKIWQETPNSVLKETRSASSQRQRPDGQQAHEKVLNIISQQGNASYNHKQIQLHTYQNG